MIGACSLRRRDRLDGLLKLKAATLNPDSVIDPFRTDSVQFVA